MEIKKKELIKTERLEIKPYSSNDIEQLVLLLKNEEISKTFMIPNYDNDEKFYQLADRLISFSKTSDTTHLEYGIYLNDYLIGFINDCGYDEKEIEIGYVIDPKYQNKGYCSEAVKAIINELFALGFTTIKAGYFEENIASSRVMEKCGMKQTDEVDTEEYRGIIHTCRYYSISKK